MSNFFYPAVLLTAILCALANGPAAAGQADLDRAVERYYAGYPAQAIAMLEPLALAGDTEAQYLLGNIVYALAQSGLAADGQEPIRWYRMAAAQGSAEASYALGAIYHNRWLASRNEREAQLAERYYQAAADLGHEPAAAVLLKFAARNQANRDAESRVYTNADFATTRAPAPADEESAARTAGNALADFTTTGDPVADAHRLQGLLAQLGERLGLPDELAGDDSLPDETTLTRILNSLGADPQLIDNLGKLLEHFRSATEHGLDPGSN